jgi:DtxR family transcriptional regulator, Mn-dependent transcriptional regulator
MAKTEKRLSESLEDYLEIILDLEKSNKVARAKDIAEKMDVLRGSVTGVLKTLAQKGLINYEPYSFITLTKKGSAIAKEITRRHNVIKAFLQNVLLLDADRAEENACRMEHAMDKTATDRLVQFIDYVYQCPRTGDDWVHAFVNYYSKGEKDQKICKKCLEDCLTRFKEELRIQQQ